VGTKAGLLGTYRIGEVEIDEGVTCLQFDAYCPTDRIMTVKVYRKEQPDKAYAAQANIKGGAWCRTSLDFAFFVNGLQHLEYWRDINCLEFLGAEGVLFNNFILV